MPSTPKLPLAQHSIPRCPKAVLREASKTRASKHGGQPSPWSLWRLRPCHLPPAAAGEAAVQDGASLRLLPRPGIFASCSQHSLSLACKFLIAQHSQPTGQTAQPGLVHSSDSQTNPVLPLSLKCSTWRCLEAEKREFRGDRTVLCLNCSSYTIECVCQNFVHWEFPLWLNWLRT